eukprot:SAG11_NODE_76_length_18005_cov_6.523958_5_plen_84_part_00
MPRTAWLALWGYATLGLSAVRLLAPNFAHFEARRGELDGRLRTLHRRLTGRAEEVAFLGGGAAGAPCCSGYLRPELCGPTRVP